MYRNANYCAFYVDEPFNETNLGANTAKDFRYYNLLKAWKASDSNFPFINAHEKTYSVRDESDWERTLKPRLHERLRTSKNIVLFLSSITRNSRALREEIAYGCLELGLPMIVVYPEYKKEKKTILKYAEKLWDSLPVIKKAMEVVPSLHIPMEKTLVEYALANKGFTIQNKCSVNKYYYK